MNDRTLTLTLAGVTDFAFVLLLAAADAGAPEKSVLTAMCVVAFLGAMTLTSLLASRLTA